MTGPEIRELRLKLGMTQVQLARELGCRGETISDWETGKRKPQPVFVKALRRLEDIPVA